jgi:3-hydroxy-5-methyl-1-naphthoate 3-O-methyltransferase
LRECHAALPRGGAVIVSELPADDERSGPTAAAPTSLDMLVDTEGRNYTPAEHGALLERSGSGTSGPPSPGRTGR